ncbi:hypothetical protein M0813_22097 [Anaeramoeba flamelloides]|uniref:Uncharacterized protein n=1 Tax=Anaeramoeba flamelloides TaxID=1746091 RepID=A0ABQ8YGH8_9EUKA|nr:hypothetical protein M0813_22097 [Anaeramoeba flamelloides]
MNLNSLDNSLNLSDLMRNEQLPYLLNSCDSGSESIAFKHSRDLSYEDFCSDFESTTGFLSKLPSSNNNSNDEVFFGDTYKNKSLSNSNSESNDLIQASLENFQLKDEIEQLEKEIQLMKWEIDKERLMANNTARKLLDTKRMLSFALSQEKKLYQNTNKRRNVIQQQTKKKNSHFSLFHQQNNQKTRKPQYKQSNTQKPKSKSKMFQNTRNKTKPKNKLAMLKKDSLFVQKKKKAKKRNLNQKKPQQKILDSSNFSLFVSQLKQLQTESQNEN